ncbi:hypothetical protein ES689_12080 [Frigoribacterium sp. ACAM 257]|nr:hypothetical protein ES689_12080 [Frigoribacterium sp. ACAM 257]
MRGQQDARRRGAVPDARQVRGELSRLLVGRLLGRRGLRGPGVELVREHGGPRERVGGPGAHALGGDRSLAGVRRTGLELVERAHDGVHLLLHR